MTRISLLFASSLFLATPAVSQTLPEGALPPLSPQVARQIELLAMHGSRFDKAIKAIEAAALLPSWGSDEGCGHEDGHEALDAPAM